MFFTIFLHASQNHGRYFQWQLLQVHLTQHKRDTSKHRTCHILSSVRQTHLSLVEFAGDNAILFQNLQWSSPGWQSKIMCYLSLPVHNVRIGRNGQCSARLWRRCEALTLPRPSLCSSNDLWCFPKFILSCRFYPFNEIISTQWSWSFDCCPLPSLSIFWVRQSTKVIWAITGEAIDCS